MAELNETKQILSWKTRVSKRDGMKKQCGMWMMPGIIYHKNSEEIYIDLTTNVIWHWVVSYSCLTLWQYKITWQSNHGDMLLHIILISMRYIPLIVWIQISHIPTNNLIHTFILLFRVRYIHLILERQQLKMSETFAKSGTLLQLHELMNFVRIGS